PGSSLGRLAGPRALKKLRALLADGAAAAVLLPPGAAARDVDAVARDAAAVFGGARVADLSKGGLVLASPTAIETDPARIDARLKTVLTAPIPDLAAKLAAAVHWRGAPSAK
ncbi:MAG: hypothetical protein ACHQ2Z_17095, partial [Elusimicrobiota bacterium]